MSDKQIRPSVSERLEAYDTTALPKRFKCEEDPEDYRVPSIECNLKLGKRGSLKYWARGRDRNSLLYGLYHVSKSGKGIEWTGVVRLWGKRQKIRFRDHNMNGVFDKGDAVVAVANDKKVCGPGALMIYFDKRLDKWLIFKGADYCNRTPTRTPSETLTKEEMARIMKPLQARYQSALRAAGFELVRVGLIYDIPDPGDF